MELQSETAVSGYRFSREHLSVSSRIPGISAFMRIRNGADFLEATIRSHIGDLDEIVAVHNQCTDGTPQILARLQAEFGPKLKVFHYADRVFPPGSDGHANEAADSPASFVNMSNFALSRTTRTIVMKLDDDHLAMEDRFAALAASVRRRGCRLTETLCFSGINLAWRDPRNWGIPAIEPLVGAGDHFLFEVTPTTVFVHDKRLEDFRHGGRRVFGDLTYWHLKYLKKGAGFGNYELDGAGNERFRRKKERFAASRSFLTLDGLRALAPAGTALLARLPLPEKPKLKAQRWLALRDRPPGEAELTRVFRDFGFETEPRP